MNKKGYSFGLWTEAILSIMLVIILVSIWVLPWMNTTYHQNYDMGLNTSSMQQWQNIERSANGQTGGDVTQTDQGLTLSSSWAMAKGVYDGLVSFFSGNFIESVVINVLGMPQPLAVVIRVLFLFSLIWLLIKLFFKVTA